MSYETSDDESYRETPSGSYSPPPTSIFRCRWNWCRESFNSNSTLNNHVIYAHVRKEPPIYLADLGLYIRAEDGGGESFSLAFSAAEASTAGESPV